MNRLQDQTSPYLLQHADNPVHWQPWDAEALALAKAENKPILLSIGYSANHMCHVMANESFENHKVAAFMNENFVNIKVDREERPDLDRIYQAAQQLLNRQPGGWPLTMILEPEEQLPVFGGTYFPPQQSRNSPSFRDVINGIAKTFDSQNEKMAEFKTKMREALAPLLGDTPTGELDATIIDRACGQIDSSFDEQHGGFSAAPKSPHSPGLEMMLEVAACSDTQVKTDRLHHMLDLTLSAMSRGGLFDHLGGGFFGYSVDVEWNIPHFEKMLSDNAQLLSIYARRSSSSGAPQRFTDVAIRTADWIIREMQLDNGGFCSSLDSDVDGVEGNYYLWMYDDVREKLGDNYNPFAAAYGLEDKANFGTSWHLRLPLSEQSGASEDDKLESELNASRQMLLSAREQRVLPARDDKVMTGWNALTVRGLAEAGRRLKRPDYIDAATRSVDYLYATHWCDNRLFATSRNGEGRLNGYVDDYALLIDALLVLLSARWRDSDLAFAIAIAKAMIENFEDSENGGFFFTSHDHESLIQRNKPFGDDTLPAANGSACRSLLELGFLLGEPRYISIVERALRASMMDIDRWPSAHATLVRALLDYTTPRDRVILRCDAESQTTAWADISTQRLSVRGRCYIIPIAAELPSTLSTRVPADNGSVTAYVTCGNECSAPITTLEEFDQHLNK